LGHHFKDMRRGLSALLLLAAATVAIPAFAQGLTQDQQKAQEHFQRARELYQAGRYHDAVGELEVARGLDPKAKDLVMNLGIVHEKLGKYDEAITNLKAFLEMDGVTAAERAKAEGMIKRIEGAKRAAPATKEPAPPVPPAPAPAPAPPAPPATKAPAAEPAGPPPKGRVDGLTVVAGSVAAAGFLTFGGAGIYALTSKPNDDFVTGRDGTFASLEDKAGNAHTAALVADVALGVGIVATIATLWLYFGRTKDVDARAASRLFVGTF
jgi:tetratricopeptide (TPR) repeat protein